MKKCDVKRCRKAPLLSYTAFGPRRTKEVSVCEYHWEKHCDEADRFDLREYFYPSVEVVGVQYGKD